MTSAARGGRPALAVLLLTALLLLGLVPGAHAAKVWKQGDLWSFVDRRQVDVEPRWQADRGVYLPVGNTDDVRLDANMLAVHAAAAQAGHRGAARKDDRVVRLADALTRAPAFLAPPASRAGGQGHVPGWSSSTVDPGAQHVAIDPQVAAALAAAWEVRDVVHMPADVSARIVQTITSVADSSFYRYPAMLLDQFNWQGDMAFYAAQVSGDPAYLVGYRQQLQRFVQGTRSPLTPGRTAFLNAGLGLIYSPRVSTATGAALLSSSEYENLIFSGLRNYDQAVSEGMAPLSADDEARLKEWSQRVLYGDWTHAGELNWDTSLGTRRWQLARYWAFALQGVETLATAGRLTGSPQQAGWATWIAERSLETYDALVSRQPDHTLPSGLWGVVGRDTSAQADPIFTASRFAAHAARLALLRFGDRPAVRPPGWFAYDPDAKRLAVSTARYSTGILERHPTDDLGGIELSRLFGGSGDPVSGTGGSARSAFGLDLAIGGKVRLDTQPGRHGRLRGVESLAVYLDGHAPPRGTFSTGLVARASTANAAGTIQVDHRFDETGITDERTVRANADAVATVRLPAWGSGATVLVVGDGGRTTPLTSAGVSAKGARELLVRSKRGGYGVGLCRVPAGARLRLSTVAPVPTSTSTTRVAQVIFPAPKGQTQRIDLRLTPTIAAPQAEGLCTG